jgi:hypothetical protein
MLDYGKGFMSIRGPVLYREIPDIFFVKDKNPLVVGVSLSLRTALSRRLETRGFVALS